MEHTREDAYRAAHEAAKQELDELRPQAQKLNERITQLRYIVRGTAGILGLPISSEHDFPQRVYQTSQPRRR